MIDTKWFIGAMIGDNIILRMKLQPITRTTSKVTVQVYTYWVDAEMYNGAEVKYQCDGSGEKFDPLVLTPFKDQPSEWSPQIRRISRKWPSYWEDPQMVVCVKKVGNLYVPVATSHPEVLVHLARFEGMALEAMRHAGLYDRITYDIVARRLGGVVRSGCAVWTKLVG